MRALENIGSVSRKAPRRSLGEAVWLNKHGVGAAVNYWLTTEVMELLQHNT